ncbi:MAG TPA: winged helix DNA-binding domain-containing protein [Candidatus Limnocylindria bacterium]|nr:winged helix DNA-binding domain-containing protein [Candidatus Limnocylindria bacterium]
MSKRAARDAPVLTLRELTRATLARQMLLERTKLPVVTAIERLAALQAQWAPSPYIALWSRIKDFRREALWNAIEQKHTVIRARLMRGTLHLVSARDFYAYAVATQDLQRGAWNRLQIGRGIDPKAVAKLAVAFAREPRAKEDVVAHLTERLGEFGGPYKWLIWRFVSAHADLVSAPPGGHWAYGGTNAPYVSARHWIGGGERPAEKEAIALLIRRYLAAFGPASLADIAQFAGQVPPRIRPVLEHLAPTLARFADEHGRALFDIPRAPRPAADTEAPVRFLPRYDELLIGYAHRDRVIAAEHRPAVYAKNALIEAVFLVDGRAAGTWALERTKTDAVVRLRPFASLARSDRLAAATEGEALARFLAPELRTHGARVA